MVSYFPIVTGSLTVLGNINVSGSITTSGSITISGSITSASFASTASYWSGSIVNAGSASFASTASFVALAQSASNAVSAVTASFANNLTVAGTLTVDTNTLFVDSINNRVGVSTTTPSASLDISSTTTSKLRLSNSDTLLNEGQITGQLEFYQGDISTAGTGITGIIAMKSVARPDSGIFFGNAADMGFYISGDSTGRADLNAPYEALTLRSNGNIGIGTTTPIYKLDVSGSTRITNGLTITGSLATSGSITTTGTLTAQTLVVQTITSSVDFVTGSTRFGSILDNTHVFTGSISASGSFSLVGPSPSMILSSSGAGAVAQFSNISGSTFVGVDNLGSYILPTQRGLAIYDVSATKYLYVTSSGVGVGTTSPITTFHVVGVSDSLGRVARFNNSFSSASIDISHSTNGGVIGYANIGSGNLANVFYVSTGEGTIGSGIVINNAGHVGFATSNVTESVQAAGTISIITNSSVSSGPLIQFGSNGRIRPADTGNRLSIDGNALYLNSYISGNIITNTAGGGFSIGRSDAPSTLNISGATNGSTPVIDIKASGAGAFLRGVRMLNDGLTAGSSLMYAVGLADNYKNMGQFYFYYAANGSSSNRLSIGLHSVDDVFSIFGSGNVIIGTTSDPGYKLSLNGQPGANGYTAWTNYSDLRLKENITNLETTDILDKICAIRPVTFNYNELSGYDEATRSRRISGFIAQELMEKFPDMIGTIKLNDTEYYDTNLSNLNLYLVKAIQELNTKFEEYKATHP